MKASASSVNVKVTRRDSPDFNGTRSKPLSSRTGRLKSQSGRAHKVGPIHSRRFAGVGDLRHFDVFRAKFTAYFQVGIFKCCVD